MPTGYCTDCGNKLPPHNIGRCCPLCQEAAEEKHIAISPDYYTVRDMMEILNFKSEEQVRRLSRKGAIPGRVPRIREHLFVKKTVDKWIAEGQPISRIPTSPLQEEAKERCQKGDHRWLADEKFNGIGYRSEETTVWQTQFTIMAGYKRTCYFCGRSEFITA